MRPDVRVGTCNEGERAEEVEQMPAQVSHAADNAVQRIADASIWLLFRLSGVRT
jgi:hypothetical protein